MIADYELPKYMADNLEVRRYIYYQYKLSQNIVDKYNRRFTGVQKISSATKYINQMFRKKQG